MDMPPPAIIRFQPAIAPQTRIIAQANTKAQNIQTDQDTRISGGIDGSHLPTQYLSRPGGRIAFDDTQGSGPVVLAITGMGERREQYRYLRQSLQQAGYRLVTMDLRGQGESSTGWKDYSVRATGDDMLALLNHLGVSSATLVGNSFGAGSAVWAAQDEPQKVNGLVLLGPAVRGHMPFCMKPVLNLALSGPWGIKVWMWYWNKLFPTRKPADYDAYAKMIEATMKDPGHMKALRKLMSIPKGDTEKTLGNVHQPTFVIMGTKDIDFKDPASEARFIAGKTGGQAYMVEGAGHYPHAEIPEQVTPRIIEFLRSLHANAANGTR